MTEEEKALKKREPTSTSWKKGQSGNPKGRAPRQTEREYLDIMMEECTPDRWRNVVQKAIKDAEKGDKFARDFLGGYLLGEPKKVHEYLVQENKSVVIRVEFVEQQSVEIVEGETREILELTEGEEDE